MIYNKYEDNMEILSVKQIREYIPNCTEIRMCPDLPICTKNDKRICSESERPCYMTFKKEKLEGIIRIDFKNAIIIVNRLNEDHDYAGIIRPDGVHIEYEGKEVKEQLKKSLKSLMERK
jgi:hypothetical protein